MNPRLKSRTTLLTSALFLVLFAPHRLPGNEVGFVAYNCAITPPDGWPLMTNLPPQPGLVAAFGKADKTALLILVIDERNKPAGPMDEQSVINFEAGVENSGGGKRLSGRFFEMAGIKAYERVGNASVKGRHASTIMNVVPADGKFYNVQVMRFDGDATADSEILKALASFRFLKAPSVSIRTSPSGSAAYESGKLAATAFAVMLTAGVLTIVAIMVVRAARRRQIKRDSVTPPALPPTH